MSARLITVSAELAALAETARDEARADEPYRRALRVIRGRLTATAAEILDRAAAARARPGPAAVRRRRPNCGPISTPSTRRCVRTAARCWPTIGWRGCEKACASSGFTCAAWTCGRTPTCTKRWSPSCWPGPGCTRTTRRCPKTNASSCWWPNSAPAARWSATAPQLSELARRELGVVAAAARAVELLRPGGGAQLRHLDVPVGVGHVGGRDPAERGWPAGRLRAGAVLPGGHLAAVRDDRRPAQRGGDSAGDAGPSAVPGAGGRPRRLPGSDARLLRLQQGRRVPGRELGGLPGRTRPGRSGPQDRNPVAALPRPRRHRRPRRRPQLRRHPGATAGSGERVAAAHRAG